MFRRTFQQLMKAGNLWDKGKEIYGNLPKKIRPRTKGGTHFIFPHGPEVEYSHCQHESNKENLQGAELTFIGIDEACQFPWSVLEYYMSRLRSPSKYKSRMVMSCNPDPDHKICELIDWYLNEEGFPIKEREGVLRYFIQLDGTFHWADTPEELQAEFNDINPFTGELEPCDPKSFTFVGSTCHDNPVLLKTNPGYLASLKALNKVDRDRLLWGNWKVRPEGANFFKRDWLQKVETFPADSVCCRAWDKASSEPSDIERKPDFTACCKMYKDRQGDFYIVGDFHESNKLEGTEEYGHFRKRPGSRDMIIERQAQHDGPNCPVVMPQDPGAGGAAEYISAAKKLAATGIIVRKEKMGGNIGKLAKFSPFAAAAENGFVKIVESTFRNKATLEAFYRELEQFDGQRSTRNRHDD